MSDSTVTSSKQFVGLGGAFAVLFLAVVAGTWWWMERDRDLAKEEAKGHCALLSLGKPMTWAVIQPQGPFWPEAAHTNEAFYRRKGQAKASEVLPDGDYVAHVTQARWATASCKVVVFRGGVVRLQAVTGEGPLKGP